MKSADDCIQFLSSSQFPQPEMSISNSSALLSSKWKMLTSIVSCFQYWNPFSLANWQMLDSLTLWNLLRSTVLQDANFSGSDYSCVWMICDWETVENRNCASLQSLTIWKKGIPCKIAYNWWKCQWNEREVRIHSKSICSNCFKTMTNRLNCVPMIIVGGMLHCWRRWNVARHWNSFGRFAYVQRIAAKWWCFKRHASEKRRIGMSSEWTPSDFNFVNVALVHRKRYVIG